MSLTEVAPWREDAFLKDPVITSDALLRRGPGPASWSSRGQVAYYRVADPQAMTLQLMVADVPGSGAEGGTSAPPPQAWSAEPFAAFAGQGSVMDRNFAGAPTFSPDGSAIAVSGRVDGEELAGIYLFTAPGEYRRVTRTFGNHRHPAFSADGERLAFVSNSGGRDSIWVVPVEGGAASEVVPEEYHACNPVFSPCGQYVAFTALVGEDALSCRVGVVELASGQVKLLTPGGNVHSRFPRWAPEGPLALYVLSDVYGFDAVWRVDVATERMTRVTPKRSADVGEFAVSSDGGTIVYVAYDRTDAQLWAVSSAGADARRLDAGHGVHHWPVIEPGGQRVWVRRETPASPAEPVLYRLDGDVALASVELPEGVAVSQVRFQSFDGQYVDGVLYHPAGTSAEAAESEAAVLESAGSESAAGPGGRPALLYIHGGPNGQHTNGYWPLFHQLVLEGFVVLAPNCRGSTGYGREWMDANIHDWGEGDRGDWVAAVEYLKSLGYVDGAKVGIWGRSYGGYSTVRGLALEPDTFAAGIAHFGPIDLAEFYEETTVRHLMLHNFGHPRENPESYLRCSTHQHLDSVRGPLLMLQGAADAGVPPDQMRLVHRSLAGRGHPSWYVEYPREGHGFDEPEHVYDAAARIRQFWSEKLAGRE